MQARAIKRDARLRVALNMTTMLAFVRRVLGYQMTIAEWIGTALLLGAPYLVIGFVWSVTHTGHLAQLGVPARVVSLLAAIMVWPVLVVADVCTT